MLQGSEGQHACSTFVDTPKAKLIERLIDMKAGMDAEKETVATAKAKKDAYMSR